jgi:nucleotide-binding universal stress UspA family protein
MDRDDAESTPGPAAAAAARRFRHVACCVDGAAGDEAAVAVGRALAGEDGRLSVVHVARGPLPELVGGPRGEADPAAGARRLAEAAAEAIGAEPVILQGVPGPAICRWAEDAGADLLVVASRHPGRWGMSVLGTVTRHVVDHAPCAVLVVRHGEA